MLATSPFHTPTSSPPFAFLPAHPSPLSPRSANIHGPRRVGFMSSFTTTGAGTSHEKASVADQENNGARVPFSKRAVKKAPGPKSDELKERRRDMFLKKVKQGREDKRFEARGEDIMRLDFMQRQKQWEAERARDAPLIPSDPLEAEDDEDAYDLPTSSGNAMQFSQPSTQLPVPEEDEVDEVAQMEDRELEALLEYMPVDGSDGKGAEPQSQNLWSDDDEYEELFSEFMEQDLQSSAQQGQQQQQESTQQGEAMDMS